MTLRSPTQRPIRAGVVRPLAVALCAVGIIGCQSNSQRDLVARDRRMQEDQIYALQDYIRQYQHLVRNYRLENSSLRQQLAEGSVTESPDRAPVSAAPRSSPAPSASPGLQTPIPPVPKEPPPATPNVEPPAVPPLKSTTGGARPWKAPSRFPRDADNPGKSSHDVLPASYDEAASAALGSEDDATSTADSTVDGGAPSEVVSTPEKSPPESWSALSDSSPSAYHELPGRIMLSGEVFANDDGGGPRLMVDVVPFAANSRGQAFDGSISLLLSTTNIDGQQHELGRWNFTAGEVDAALVRTASSPTMRFFVELPPDAAVDGPTHLWVRLEPRQGIPRLAHASVDLELPGVFASRSAYSSPVAESVVAANFVEGNRPANETPTNLTPTTLVEGDWSIARPGQPANSSATQRDQQESGWRTSTETLEVAVAHSTAAPNPAAGAAPVVEPAPLQPIDELRAAVPDEPARRPIWSPDRVDDSLRRTASRPTWSVKR